MYRAVKQIYKDTFHAIHGKPASMLCNTNATVYVDIANVAVAFVVLIIVFFLLPLLLDYSLVRSSTLLINNRAIEFKNHCEKRLSMSICLNVCICFQICVRHFSTSQ